MAAERVLDALLISEGSGGHVIPALEVARHLAAQGSRVTLWYARRQQIAPLTEGLLRAAQAQHVRVEAILTNPTRGLSRRVRACATLWVRAHRHIARQRPDVVVAFGGWLSIPVIAAARQWGIACLLHEQNVELGLTNRLLARWVDRIAMSFESPSLGPQPSRAVVTGLPIRPGLDGIPRALAARRFELEGDRPTVLVLGGSQGAHAINELFVELTSLMSESERRTWQFVHLAGASDDRAVRAAYAGYRIRAHVAKFCPDMQAAYALADVVVARSGASTIAELAQCGRPAVLIPYPLAHGHQRANARLVESVGGGLRLEETEATPERLLWIVRQFLQTPGLRQRMGEQLRALARPDATARLAGTITALGISRRPRTARPASSGMLSVAQAHPLISG